MDTIILNTQTGQICIYIPGIYVHENACHLFLAWLRCIINYTIKRYVKMSSGF